MKKLICKRSLLVVAAGVLLALAPGHAEENQAAAEEGIWTHTYIVPPSFQSSLENLAKEIQEEAAENRKNREGLKKAFERCGVTFPEGASVTYNPGSSTLIVRNTQDQMPVVESLIDSLVTKPQPQVHVVIKEIRLDPDEARKKWGEDDWLWLLKAPPQSGGHLLPEGSSGLATSMSEEALVKELSRPPRPLPAPQKPAEAGLAGVFTDPQLQVVLRELSKIEGVDILTAPSFMTFSGHAGLSRVDQKRWGVMPVIGPDQLTIDLSLYFPPEGEALDPANQISVTIWDGQTAVYRDRVDGDEIRLVFVTATLIDPAGLPVNQKEKAEKPKPKPKATPVHSRPAAEIEKERDATRAADRIGLRGYDKLLAGDFKGSAADFEAALEKLPEGSGLRRDSFGAQLKKARAGLKQLQNTK